MCHIQNGPFEPCRNTHVWPLFTFFIASCGWKKRQYRCWRLRDRAVVKLRINAVLSCVSSCWARHSGPFEWIIYMPNLVCLLVRCLYIRSVGLLDLQRGYSKQQFRLSLSVCYDVSLCVSWKLWSLHFKTDLNENLYECRLPSVECILPHTTYN